MATYRVENIEFAVVELGSAEITFDVERLDVDVWVLVKSAAISTGTRGTAIEIAKEIRAATIQIATKDSFMTSVYEDVLAIVSGEVIEI